MPTPDTAMVRDTITMPRATAELLRDLTAWRHYHGDPRAIKGDVVTEALHMLAEHVAREHDIDMIPPRGDYSLRWGPRT